MKMIQGACFLPCSKRSRTRLAPTPTNISTKSAPLMEKNGTSASPATARAKSVFPVPGGPSNSAPRGILPPSFWNFFGSLKNAIISCNSSFASSAPATSEKVTGDLFSMLSLARLFPKEKSPRGAACLYGGGSGWKELLDSDRRGLRKLRRKRNSAARRAPDQRSDADPRSGDQGIAGEGEDRCSGGTRRYRGRRWGLMGGFGRGGSRTAPTASSERDCSSS